MATGDLKVDRINDAYEQMRISGLTVKPSAYDNKRALAREEMLANELSGKNVCVNYNFEDEPDLNTPSGIEKQYWFAFSCVLAKRLLSVFGKGEKPDPMLLTDAKAGLSTLHSGTARVEETQYPTRQSIGAGNRLRHSRLRTFYNPVNEAPNDCETNRMVIDDVQDFVEHFDSFLISPEVITSYTISANSGLTIQSDSNTDYDVNYRIKAVGTSSTTSDSLQQVKIVMTTDDGRVETRLINFELTLIRDPQ